MWIHGIGHFHPENEITNAFLEELDIGTTNSWIMERVGIRSRRTVLPLDYIRETRNADPRGANEAALYNNASTGQRAAEMAVSRAGLQLENIGMVISGSCAPDTTVPADACNIAAALGLEVPSFDIASACTTFGAQLHALSLMRPEKLPRFILIVVPENTTRAVDFRDRRTAVLWGDGTAAAVLSAVEPGPIRIAHVDLASSPAGAGKVVIPRNGHFFQDGRAVQRFAISRTSRCVTELRAAFPAVDDSRLHFIGHQANQLMLDAVCRACDIPPERHHSNVADFGNTGAAGAPGALSQDWHRFAVGDHIALVGVGGGLTWTSAMLRFESLPAVAEHRPARAPLASPAEEAPA
ncbi:MAG: 3-oxoacyl-ACP synthase III family protein [Candidatus Binatia bacterium]